MKDTTRRTPPADPSAERTADQSTQENAGLHGGVQGVRPGSEPDLVHDDGAEDALNRSAEERYQTPRHYEGTSDPALTSDDSSLNTKI
jgi:hypothetical protein